MIGKRFDWTEPFHLDSLLRSPLEDHGEPFCNSCLGTPVFSHILERVHRSGVCLVSSCRAVLECRVLTKQHKPVNLAYFHLHSILARGHTNAKCWFYFIFLNVPSYHDHVWEQQQTTACTTSTYLSKMKRRNAHICSSLPSSSDLQVFFFANPPLLYASGAYSGLLG